MSKFTGFESIVGSTFVSVTQGKRKNCYDDADDNIIFVRDDGKRFEMFHGQDCCENVYIESIVGDLQDLVGVPILMAEEATNSSTEEERYKENSWTYTFYKLATIKGYVDIRWYGSSNGHYSEGVYFGEMR